MPNPIFVSCAPLAASAPTPIFEHSSPLLRGSARVDGRSFDVPLAELDLGSLSSDREIKQALAEYLNVPAGKFRHYVIDRHSAGHLTVRPEAVFG